MSHQVSITRGFGIETPSNGAGGRQGPSPASCWELGLCQHREPYLGQKPSDAAEDGAWFVVSSAPSVSTGGSRLYLLRVQKKKGGKEKKKVRGGAARGSLGKGSTPPSCSAPPLWFKTASQGVSPRSGSPLRAVGAPRTPGCCAQHRGFALGAQRGWGWQHHVWICVTSPRCSWIPGR